MPFLSFAGAHLVLLVWGIALAQRNAVQVPVESGAITDAFELALMITGCTKGRWASCATALPPTFTVYSSAFAR